jgi:hypothetical protein
MYFVFYITVKYDKVMLPSPNQTWAHSTCTIKDLKDSLRDDSITAIESDILMGTTNDSFQQQRQPIMAHPPERTSDLTFKNFIHLTRTATTHLKLDVKEKECIQSILEIVRNERLAPERALFFNADILPGPGVRDEVPITPEAFLKPILSFIEETKGTDVCAFSLGWRTDCRSLFGYTEDDVNAMRDLIHQYSLIENSMGVVLAVNARVLVKSLGVLDDLLKELSNLQLLVWTGTGEPAISNHLQQRIKQHFCTIGCQDQVGFDCKVCTVIKNCNSII